MNDLDATVRFRGTGRTTRAIEQAINSAEDGKYVLFITGCAREKNRAFRLAYEALRRKYGPDAVRLADPKIYIPAREQKNGTGSITFEEVKRVNVDWDRGIVAGAHHSCELIIDPYAIEVIFGNVVRLYHKYDPTRDEVRRTKGFDL